MPDEGLKQLWDAGLTESEYGLIGLIVSHWGAIEGEIFNQTLISFDLESDSTELPREMNNLSFSAVLKLWKERVADFADNEAKAVLNKQHEKITSLQEYRNALIHGMWQFDLKNPKEISTKRVRKKEIISTRFKDGDLYHFYTELAQINLYIRSPGGMQQIFEERAKEGFYVNEAELRRIKLKSNLTTK